MATWIPAWTPLSPSVWLCRPSQVLPFPLGEPGCTLHALGRHAIFHGARALGLSDRDEILAPAYHAGSDIEALRVLGARFRFYDATDSLAPDPDELESLLGPDTRALFLIHHLGFPQDAVRWRRWCDERNLLLIEDAAQSWLATWDGAPLGSYGDMALVCMYKMLPLADGAALITRAPLQQPSPTPAPFGLAGVGHSHGSWLGHRIGSVGAARSLLRQRSNDFDPASYVQLGDPDLAPTRLSLALLRRLAASSEDVRERRRANYEFLLSRLAEFVPPPFDRLPRGACPWMLPVTSPAKHDLLAHLRRRRIGAMDFWSARHPALTGDSHPNALARGNTTVAIGVHQELRSDDLGRIVAAVSEFFRA